MAKWLYTVIIPDRREANQTRRRFKRELLPVDQHRYVIPRPVRSDSGWRLSVSITTEKGDINV